MPHGARKVSESGYYHVVPKGINAQIIFGEDADRLSYLDLMARAKKDTDIRIHAYCLMSNHVHLVLEDPHRKLSEFIKYVHERYGTKYSKKYDRVGGVFAKTCWSEPIETEEYLLCAVRYVHANPAHAGICKAAAYDWSSAKEYLGQPCVAPGIAETSMVLDMCGGVQGFVQFSQPSNATFLPFPGSRLRNHSDDQEALRIAEGVLGFSPSCLASKDQLERDRGLILLSQRGFNGRQIARITGIGRSIVQRCIRATEAPCATGVPPL